MEIYARNISNLTDARYFAALGASWLEFSLNGLNMNATEFNAMKEWITGPQWVMSLCNINEMDQQEFISNSELGYFNGDIEALKERNLSFVNCKYEDLVNHINQHRQQEFSWVIEDIEQLSPKEISKLALLAKSEYLFICVNRIPQDGLLKIIQLIQPKGIVLHGGKEEKTGFKSYDDIDDLIEMLIQADIMH